MGPTYPRCSASAAVLLAALAFFSTLTSSQAFRCNKTAPVLDPMYLCDGSNDCSNGADENPFYCAKFNCSEGSKVRCPGSKWRCVSPMLLCDGTPNCPNGTDETKKTCKNYECSYGSLKCPDSGICSLGGALCNGDPDCPKNSRGVPSDEDLQFCRRYKCPSGFIKCKDGSKCIPKNLRCDSVKDCKDGSDESPDICKSFDCKKNGRLTCPTGGRCLPDPCMICDCIKDCKDGSDELKKYCSLRNTTACGAPYPCYNTGFP